MTPFGRESELAAARRCFEAVPESGLRVLVVEGQAGIGKTTVLRAVSRLADDLDHRVLSCRPVEAEAKLAFTSLADLLVDVRAEDIAALPEPQRTALDVALLRAAPAGAPPNSRVLGTAVASLLATMASRPVALVIDDVQWLDRASAAALAFAIRRVEHLPVAVVLAARTEGRSPLDALGLDRALSTRPEHLQLGPLTLSALYHVIRRSTGLSFPRPTLQRIEEASGGNPLFAVELARALHEVDGRPGPGQPLPVPDSLGPLIRARVAKLPAAWEQPLLAAASLATPTVDVLERALQRDISEVLEGAVDAAILEVRGERIRFTHPLLASELVASASLETRRDVHRLLAAVSDDAEQRARHLALASNGPSEDVAVNLETAAREASVRGAPDAAAELLELSCRLTPPSSGDAIIARRLALSEASLRAGDTERVEQIVGELLAAVAEGPFRAMALELQARVLHVTGSPQRAADTCQEALAHAGDDLQLLARVHATRALVDYQDTEVAHRHARVALDLLAQVKDPDPAVHAQAILAFAEAEVELGRGIPEDEIKRGLELERLAPAPSVADRISAALGAWLKAAGRLDEARHWLEVTRRAAIEEGDEGSMPYALSHIPQLELWSGNWEAAERTAREHYDVSERTGQAGQRVQALYNLALVHAHQGRIDEATAELDEALRECEVVGDTWSVMPLSAVLGFVRLSLGDAAGAREHLDRAAAIAASTGGTRVRRQTIDHIEALILIGDLSRATHLLEAAEAGVLRESEAELVAGLLRNRALLAAASQQLDEALHHATEAVREHERSSEPFGLARTLLVLGQVQRRRGERRAAAEALEAARKMFESLGAPLWVERAEAELARVPRRRGSTTLTATEERVAELVTQGLTNQEVAQALFVNVKTVEANLTRIYAKLGVRSRAALAAARAQQRGEGGGANL